MAKCISKNEEKAERGARMTNRRSFGALVAAALLFAGAPVVIAMAPYEATMGLVAKIFYFHVPAWFMMFGAIFVCGTASGIYVFSGRQAADRLAVAAAEVALLFGLMGLVTGPLWGRVSWGTWWPWDVRTTLALLLQMNFVAYLLLRQYGGPGSDRLAAGLAVFGMFNVPFVYVSVNVWRTLHPQTTVLPQLPLSMGLPFLWCVLAYLALLFVMLEGRRRLEEHRAAVDRLRLACDDGYWDPR
ncbi:MAG: cytochrome c biogenesis protein CcsA [Acidobacteria bacterium]|nr:cytochrome c biogenesis protein CcsA [Acidobacteriota bacterium]